MFNWFDKLLVKIAKKILNKYAPTGEFIAYINEQEEKVLKKLGGYGQPVNETGVKSFFIDLGEIWENTQEFFSNNKDIIVDVGMGIGKAWVDMNDQERKSAITEKAYNDYMAQKEAAGKEAQSAIDLNLTPMQITNIPTTKADVSDFTLVGAKGGLMTLPNKQRKRYAFGPNEIDVEAMQEESIGPYELQMEEGVNISPMVEEDKQKQLLKDFAKYQAGGGTLSLEEFALIWIEENAARPVEGDMKMASAPGIPGIEGLRHGGRPGYKDSNITEFMTEEEASIGNPGNAEMYEEEIIRGTSEDPTKPLVINSGEGIKVVISAPDGTMVPISKEDYYKVMNGEITQEEALANAGYESSGIQKIQLDFENLAGGNAKGGLPKRVKRAPGGIMNLGGLEKDYRTTGGFVPIGGRERADDVPARLSKNEFVMTADAVRAAGGGSINKGAQRMYDTMKHLEAQPQARRMIS